MSGRMLDRFTVWLILKRPANVAVHLASISVERTMRFGMTLVEAAMKRDPEAGARVIASRGGNNWEIINTTEEHTGCYGGQVH